MQKRHKSLLSNNPQEQTGKPPAAKPLRSRWIPEDDPTPRVSSKNLQLRVLQKLQEEHST